MSKGAVDEEKNRKLEIFLNSVTNRWLKEGPSENLLTGTGLIIFSSELEFFSAFNAIPGRLVARCAILRSMMEVLADISHMTRDPSKKEERAKKYVESARELREKLLQAILDIKAGETSASMGQLTDWTTSKIEHRLNAITPSMAQMYDVLSYCSHSHPGKAWLFGDEPDNGPIGEPYLRRMCFAQMVSVAARCGDLGVLNDEEKNHIEDLRRWVEQTIE